MKSRHVECNGSYEVDFAKELSFGDITFSEEQRSKNLELYRRVQKLLPIDDVYKLNDCDLLYRFLIGKHWQVNAAEESLREYVTRRAEQHLNTILLALVEPEIALIGSSIYGFDNFGQPILWIAIDPLYIMQVLKMHGTSEVLRAQIRTMEMVRCICKRHAKEKCLCVIDLGKVTMSSLNTTTLTFLREFSKVVQEYYPEVVHRMLIYNSGWAVTAAWKIVKPFVDERVQRKIRFFNVPPTRENLLEFMSSDNVLREFVEEETDSLLEKKDKKLKKLNKKGYSIQTYVKNKQEVLQQEKHINIIEREINEEIARLRAEWPTRQVYIGSEEYQREQEQLWFEQNQEQKQQTGVDVNRLNISTEKANVKSTTIHELTHNITEPVQPITYPLQQTNCTEMSEPVPELPSESPIGQTLTTQLIKHNNRTNLLEKKEEFTRNIEYNNKINDDDDDDDKETKLKWKSMLLSNEKREQEFPSSRETVASSRATTPLRINGSTNKDKWQLFQEEQSEQLEENQIHCKQEEEEYEQEGLLERQESEWSQEETSRLTTSKLKVESKRISDVSFDSLMVDDRGEKERVLPGIESLYSTNTSLQREHNVLKENNNDVYSDDDDDGDKSIYSLSNSITFQNNNDDTNNVQLSKSTTATLVIGTRAVLFGEVEENTHVVHELLKEHVNTEIDEYKPGKHVIAQDRKVSVFHVPRFTSRTETTTTFTKSTNLPCNHESNVMDLHDVKQQYNNNTNTSIENNNDNSSTSNSVNGNANTNKETTWERCNKQVEQCQKIEHPELEIKKNEKEEIQSDNSIPPKIDNEQLYKKQSTHLREESEQKEYQENEWKQQRVALHVKSNHQNENVTVGCKDTSHHHCFTRIKLLFHPSNKIIAYCSNYEYIAELFENIVCIRLPFSTSTTNSTSKQGTNQAMLKHTANIPITDKSADETRWEESDKNEPIDLFRSKSTDLPASHAYETTSSLSSTELTLHPRKEEKLLSSSSAASVTDSESTASLLSQNEETDNVPHRMKGCKNNVIDNLENDKHKRKPENAKKDALSETKEMSEHLLHSSPEEQKQPHFHIVGELLKEAGHPIHPCLLICNEKRHVLFILQKSRLRNRLTLYKLVVDSSNERQESTRTPRALFRKLSRSIRSSSLLSSHSHEHYNLQEKQPLSQKHMKQWEQQEKQQRKCRERQESHEFSNQVFTSSLRHPFSASSLPSASSSPSPRSSSSSSSSSRSSYSETFKQYKPLNTPSTTVKVSKNGKYTCQGKRVCVAIIVPHPHNIHDRRSWVMYEYNKRPNSLIATTSISSTTTTASTTITSSSLTPTIIKGQNDQQKKKKQLVEGSNDDKRLSHFPAALMTKLKHKTNKVLHRDSDNNKYLDDSDGTITLDALAKTKNGNNINNNDTYHKVLLAECQENMVWFYGDSFTAEEPTNLITLTMAIAKMWNREEVTKLKEKENPPQL